MRQDYNVKPMSKASALCFTITYNLWIPMYCSQYCDKFSELLGYVIIPMIILWALYYVLALKVKLFYEKWHFNRNSIVAIFMLQFFAGVVLYLQPLKITMICLIGLFGILFLLYCMYDKLAIK